MQLVSYSLKSWLKNKIIIKFYYISSYKQVASSIYSWYIQNWKI